MNLHNVMLSAIVAMALCLSAFAQDPGKPDEAAQAALQSSYGKLPLSFEINDGQLQEYVKFACRLPHKFFIFRKEGLDIHLTASALSSTPEADSEEETPASSEHVVRVRFAGAQAEPDVVGVEKLQGTVNYFIGSDSSKWKSGVPTYSKIKYAGLYPGIELFYYSRDGLLEYDFEIAPGADVRLIQMYYEDAVRYTVEDGGDLVISMDWGGLKELAPTAYQLVDGERRTVSVRFMVNDESADSAAGGDTAPTITFEVGEYDNSLPLIIDPIIAL